MSKHFIYSREENGYHDSYFYDVFFNTETNKVEEVMTHATAWAGMNENMPTYEPMTEEVMKQLKKFMIKDTYQKLLEKAQNHTGFRVGQKVKAKRNFKHKGKSYAQGMKAVVFWNGRNHRAQEYCQVGLETSEGRIFTSAKNLCPDHSDLFLLKEAIWVTNHWLESLKKRTA